MKDEVQEVLSTSKGFSIKNNCYMYIHYTTANINDSNPREQNCPGT